MKKNVDKLISQKLSQMKYRAKKCRVAFDLDREYLKKIMKDTCKYSGRKLNYLDGKNFDRETEDQAYFCRKDCFSGFIKGNMEIVGSYVHYHRRKITDSNKPKPFKSSRWNSLFWF